MVSPYVNRINMREYTAQTSDCWRAIASKRDLKMQKAARRGVLEKFRSTKAVLLGAYALRDEEIKLLRNSVRYARSVDGPAYTITSSPIQYASNGANMKSTKNAGVAEYDGH